MAHGQFYYDKTLPLGLSYACNLFEKFSSALLWILHSKFSVSRCIHVLDDFLFLGPPQSSDCYRALLAFHVLEKEIGLTIKTEKTVYPTTQLIFMGIEFDTVCFEVRLPHDKFAKLKSRFKKFKRKSQSRCGSFNH